MRLLACSWLTVFACGFSNRADVGDDAAVDAMPDAPPATPSVRFVAVTAQPAMLRPGLYGFEVVATLRNDLPNRVDAVAVTLTFHEGATNRATDYRWRDADAREDVMTAQPQSIAADSEAMYRFRVDALPWSGPGAIAINGAATLLDGATPLSATPLEAPTPVPFVAINAPIVVSERNDENDDDTNLCFREALARAAVQPGVDRIVFDPAVFPPNGSQTTTLDENLGEITVNTDVVIDGRGAGFVVAVDSNWETPEGRYGLKIAGGNVVIGGITFRDMAYNYRNEDNTANNCGQSMAQLEGGAIRVDGGTLILDGNTFADPNVNERNCYAASVRLEGGTNHRIVNNTWTDQVMDAIYVDTATREISGNLMNAGSNLSDVDECIYVQTQGGQPLWIVGNICVDMEYSGVIARGNEGGTLYVWHNTFVRDGRVGLSAVRREGGARAVSLRNNAYVSNMPAAITLDNNGTGFDIAYESVTGSGLLNGNASMATVNTASVITPANAMLVNANGSTRTALTPTAGSPLVGSGADLLDVNGVTPGHYNGNGPERGAIELP